MCEPLQLGQGPVQAGVAVDATHVYWSGGRPEGDAGPEYRSTIYAVPKAGGAARLVVGSSEGWLPKLVLSGGKLYVGLSNVDSFRSVPVSGGTPVHVLDGKADQDTNQWDVGAGYIYVGDGCRWLRRVPLPSGSNETVFEKGCNAFSYSSVLVDGAGGYVYSLDSVHDELWKVKSSDKTEQVIRVSNSGSLAMDDTRVYWTTRNGCNGNGTPCGSIQAIPLSGGQVTTVVAPLFDDFPVLLKADGRALYWLLRDQAARKATITKAPLSGGAPFALWSGDGFQPVDFAVDDAYVYIASSQYDGILRVAK